MKAKNVIRQLKPLTGRTVSILTRFSKYVTMCVDGVYHLPPSERVTDEKGNVIIANGEYDVEGRPEGVTFWARDVESIEWSDSGVLITSDKGTFYLVFLDEDGEIKRINLASREATPWQKCMSRSDELAGQIKDILTFDDLPKPVEIINRAKMLVEIAVTSGADEAMVECDLYLAVLLDMILRREGIRPVYVFQNEFVRF